MIETALAGHQGNKSKKGVASQRSAPLAAAQAQDIFTQFKFNTMGNLKSVAGSAINMSESISQVVDNFDTILKLPGIRNFSATLESVPAIGILNGTVQYVRVSVDGDGNSSSRWDVLDSLPALPGPQETTSLFSFNGVLYVAIGRNVWSKSPKVQGDPSLNKAATDNWSEIWTSGWQALGQCFPDNRALGFAPFYALSSDGTPQDSWLIKLEGDGTLSCSKEAPREGGAKFQPLSPGPGIGDLRLVKIAYWNNAIWGYDENMVLYELHPKFDGRSGTYTIESKNTLDGTMGPVTDFTAVDTGLVVAAEGGSVLYKLVTDPPKDKASPPTQTWKPWIQQNGVTNLGAASPGVVLDLQTLTTALKATYIDTQTDLVPYIDQMLAFCTSHGMWLDDLLVVHDEWAAATDEQEKARIAENEGAVAVTHASAMGKLIGDSLATASNIVVDMTRQIKGIDTSLAAQLRIISDSLDALDATIQSEEAEKKKLTTALICAIIGAVIGLGLIILGAVIPGAGVPVIMTGGSLLVSGIISAIYAGDKIMKLNALLASQKSQVQDLTIQKEQLTSIHACFASLEDEYKALNAFWYDMHNVSTQIQALETMGIILLEDRFSIQAAQKDNQEIADALNKYLEVLGRQGIKVGSGSVAGLAAKPHAMPTSDLAKHIASIESDENTKASLHFEAVSRMMDAANEALAAKDPASYLSIMKQAVRANTLLHRPAAWVN